MGDRVYLPGPPCGLLPFPAVGGRAGATDPRALAAEFVRVTLGSDNELESFCVFRALGRSVDYKNSFLGVPFMGWILFHRFHQ